MRIITVILACLLSAGATAEQRLASLDLAALDASGALSAGRLAEDGSLTVIPDPDEALITLIDIDAPGITAPVYALKGEIAYTNVDGGAYLQLDSHFGEHGTFFSKTLAYDGPLARIVGNSDWRDFTLPFFATTEDGSPHLTPEKLSLSVFLPGRGEVRLRNLAIYEYAADEHPLSSGAHSGIVAGLYGGIAGAVVGLWGALIGVLASRGRARGFVINSANLLIALGVVSVIGGIAGLATQPGSQLYLSMLLTGGIVVFVVGALRRILPKRYEEFEVRKMQSLDA